MDLLLTVKNDPGALEYLVHLGGPFPPTHSPIGPVDRNVPSPLGKHTRIPPLNMILWPRKQDTQSSSTNLVGWVLRADKGRLLSHLDNERPFRQTAGLYPKQRRRCSSVLVFFCTSSVCQHAVVTCARTVRSALISCYDGKKRQIISHATTPRTTGNSTSQGEENACTCYHDKE